MNRVEKGPNPERIREVMKMLRNYNWKLYGEIDVGFNESRVVNDGCNTICCHAGLFNIALQNDEFEIQSECYDRAIHEDENGDEVEYYVEILKNIDGDTAHYGDGIELFTNYVYERDKNDLLTGSGSPAAQSYIEDWADNNPEIWGNGRGKFMFTHEGYLSFGSGNFVCTLYTIIEHWEGVADRKEAWDKANNITY